MQFTAFLFKNLLRRKVRSFLTTLAIALAVGVMVTLLGISDGFEESFRNIFSQRGIDLVVLSRDAPLQLTSDIDEKAVDKVRKIPGVRAVDWGLTDYSSVKKDGTENSVIVQGYLSDSFMFDKFHFSSGRKYEPGETGVALLGFRTADSLRTKVGDDVIVAGETLKVIGIYEATSVFENGFVMVPLRELQRMTGHKGKITGMSIILETGGTDYSQSVKQAIEALTDEKGKSMRLAAQPLDTFVTNASHIKIAHAMAWMTSVIAVVMGAVGMLNTMLMAVFERIKEIGILRAIGWRKSRVIKMVLGESLLLSVAGAFVGIVVAIFLTRWLTTFPQVAGFIEGDIPNWVLLEGSVMALGVGLIGGIYPALRAANLKPTEALRHE